MLASLQEVIIQWSVGFGGMLAFWLVVRTFLFVWHN